MNTAFSLLGILVLAGLVVGRQSLAPDCPRQFLGVWQYRQSAGDWFDAEGERLELSCDEQTLRGLYQGQERAGEHGLFYTPVEVRDLKVDAAGLISFVVPEGELHFQGRVEDRKLVLACTGPANSCPDGRMVFGR